MTHSFWWLLVDGLAVYRLTVLVVKDTITNPLRELAQRPWQREARKIAPRVPSTRGARWWLSELSTCPWCVSVWIACGVVALTRLAPGAWQYAALVLACSALAGFLSER